MSIDHLELIYLRVQGYGYLHHEGYCQNDSSLPLPRRDTEDDAILLEEVLNCNLRKRVLIHVGQES